MASHIERRKFLATLCGAAARRRVAARGARAAAKMLVGPTITSVVSRFFWYQQGVVASNWPLRLH
jgi:hypothetical protein